jgi:urea transport system permease protein
VNRSFIARNPSVLLFLAILAVFTIAVTVLSEGFGIGVVSTSFVKTLGKTLCLCLIAIAMDLIWGYTGILSLGHFAFFGLGGYMIGMWLMYERTRQIVVSSLSESALPPTPEETIAAIGNQIFGVVGSSEFPLVWAFADNLALQLAFVVLVPGLLALVFGWLAFRSRVTGVYMSILTQAMTLGLSLYLFQNASGLRGNNGLSGLQNLPGVTAPQSVVSLWFFWASSLALALGYLLAAWVVSGKFGSVMRAIRDNEARVRFLGYSVERYKLAVFTLTACISGIAGALYYPQAGGSPVGRRLISTWASSQSGGWIGGSFCWASALFWSRFTRHRVLAEFSI